MMASLTATTVSQISEVEMAGERFVRLSDGVLLVASKSQAGEWYKIENATCTCKGFAYRQVCRHITAAAQLDTVTVERTTEYGGGWCVRWLGFVHGGTHSNEIDAQTHAQGLREAPSWDHSAWMDRNGYGVPQSSALRLVGGR
jgi:hypothetical protein